MGGMPFIALVVFLIPLLVLAILGGLLLTVIKIWRGNPSEQSKQQREEETKLMQELYHGLSKMEKRVEALEMILFDPERKGKDERFL